MANRWGKMETVTDFIFLGSKITVDGDFSCVIKRLFLLGSKAMMNVDRVLKSRHHFADKGSYSQSYVFFFPVVRYGCESWIIKKAEH